MLFVQQLAVRMIHRDMGYAFNDIKTKDIKQIVTNCNWTSIFFF